MNRDLKSPAAGQEDVVDELPGMESADRLTALLDPEVLGSVAVELDATLGRGRLTMHRLAGLSVDDVVKLDTPLNGTVELSLNGTLVARGELVSVGDKFGVRISEILARRK